MSVSQQILASKKRNPAIFVVTLFPQKKKKVQDQVRDIAELLVGGIFVV